MDYKEFGKAIKTARKEQRMRQVDLARKAGVTPSFICKLEKGESSPSMETLKAIADVLNVKPASLLPWETPKDVDRFLPYLSTAEKWQIKAVEVILGIKKK